MTSLSVHQGASLVYALMPTFNGVPWPSDQLSNIAVTVDYGPGDLGVPDLPDQLAAVTGSPSGVVVHTHYDGTLLLEFPSDLTRMLRPGEYPWVCRVTDRDNNDVVLDHGVLRVESWLL
jgi:hypothetical protein